MKKWKYLINVSKVAIFCWMAAVIWQRFQHAPGGLTVPAIFEVWQNHPLRLLLVWLLMPLNWLLEIFKWKLLLEHSGGVPFRRAAASVLGGLSTGFASPARIGEFAGRALLLPASMRVDSLYLSALGGAAQSFVTFAAALLLWSGVSVTTSLLPAPLAIPLLLLFTLLLLSFFFFFNRTTWLHRWLPQTDARHPLPGFSERAKILVIGAIRYAVYLSQYALLFQMAGAGMPYPALFSAVAVLLAMQSLSPLSPMADVVTRGGMALLLFPNGHPAAIAAAPFVLWCINLLIPAMVGYYFILNWRDGEQ